MISKKRGTAWGVEPLPRSSDNIYNEFVVENLMENDELSYEEAAFMQGYNAL